MMQNLRYYYRQKIEALTDKQHNIGCILSHVLMYYYSVCQIKFHMIHFQIQFKLI